ncbi:DNA repair protein RAD50-like [Chrysoperla carnea]|uniref:DNA repair protein RAD50-like n=1 Tax=Chrysoperla carnea TaxID=189513 RepID=UPI001D08F97B|nr:DNA repair protein RAD50-like [Chrysoperla carnea]
MEESTVITPAKFINSLKNLKIRSDNCSVTQVQHLFDDKDIVELLTFFCNNVTSDNLISGAELNTYMHLEERNLVLDDEQLDEATCEIENAYPGLLDLNEEDLQLLEDELKDEQEYLKELETLIEIELENNGNLEGEIHSLNEENISLSVESETYNENLMKLSENLNDVQNSLKETVFDLANFYHSSSNLYTDHFIQNSKSNIDLIQNFLYNYMKTGFTNPQLQLYPFILLIANLNEHKRTLNENMTLYIVSLCELEYQKSVYETMKNFEIPNLSVNKIEFEKLRLQKNIELLENDMSSMNAYLRPSIEQMVNNKISNVLLKYTTVKLERRLERQKKVTTLSNHVINIRNQCRILDGFLHFILDGLTQNQNIILDIVRQLSNDQSNFKKRLEQMDLVINEHNKTIGEPNNIVKINEVLQILSKIARNDDDSEPENLQKLSQNCKQVEINFSRKQKNIFKMECEMFQNTLIPLKMKLKPMLKLIFSDEHSKRIVADDINILKLIHQVEKHLERDTETLENLTTKLKKIMKQISTDKWFNYHHFLWVWFLISPKKVHKVLKEIDQEIQKLTNEEK